MEDLKISKIELLNNIDYETLFGKVDNFLIDKLLYDNRLVVDNSAFVCIKGARFDTHEVIDSIIQSGAKLIIVENDIDINNLTKDNIENLTIVKVKNSRIALSLLSINYFRHPLDSLKLIGITGTKGKTTTAFMLRKILEDAGHKTGLIGTVGCEYLNKKIKTDNTTPESFILQQFFYDMKNAGIEYVVMEVSSQSFKLHRVYGMTFDYAVFTNITPDHIGTDEHKDFDEYFSCKLQIFNNCKKAVINRDDEHFDKIYDYCKKLNIEPLTYSTKGIDKKIFSNEKIFGLEFNYEKVNGSIIISMPGNHNIQNAVSAITVAKDIGISDDSIKKSLFDISVNGRVEVVHKNDDYTVLIDYAHNEIGTESLINSIREYNPKRIVVVFGSGGNRDVERRYGMGKAVGRLADFAVVTADNSRFEKTIDIINQIVEKLKEETDQYVIIEDRSEAIKYAIDNHQKGDIICIIGKGHEDYNDVLGKKTYFSDKEEVIKAINGK